MGTGSFGGGSGSFGGGGSGAGVSNGTGDPPAGGSDGANAGGGVGKKGTDSVHERIMSLSRLTDSFNANPELGRVLALIYGLLQHRTRAAFVRMVLADPLVDGAFRRLLDFDKSVRGGTDLVQAAGGVAGSLSDFADAIHSGAEGADTDERTSGITRRAISDVLLRTVKNSQDLYYDTPMDQLGGNFDPTPLTRTADHFLGTVMREALRRDLLELNPAAKAAVADACRQISISWIDRFRNKYEGKSKTVFADILKTISENYPTFAGIPE